jgi:cytochrome c55X
MPRRYALTRVAFLILAFLAGAGMTSADTLPRLPDPERRAALTDLLRHDCGACHGLHLTGGLGPPLLPESLLGKPHDSLRQVILKGRPGTPMPGWQPFLSETDADWLIEYLLKEFPHASNDR